MKHTPGPWSNAVPGFIRAIVNESGEQNIVMLLAPYSMDNDEEYRANARLIAAAPELLDELLEAERVLSTLAGVGVPNALVRIRRLLTRIEGGE